MCGRFYLQLPIETMRQLFKVESRLNVPPRYNIAPTQDILVYSIQEEIGACLLPMRWGIVPSWAKDLPKTAVFNARAETINQKPYFRGAYRHHRCLIPADGWYEWANLTGSKIPYRMHAEDGGPLVFAGVCDAWSGADGNSFVVSAAIVTRPAVGTLENVHHRMPLLLSGTGRARWMDHDPHHLPDPLDRDLLPDLGAIHIAEAHRDVGNVRNDHAGLLSPDQRAFDL
ncbi:MAG: SOS response-associated peptidase [Pseudomonadota bacterium]